MGCSCDKCKKCSRCGGCHNTCGQCKESCCKCQHNCNKCKPVPPPVDCALVVKEFHEIIGEANAIYEEAVVEVGKSLKNTVEALNNLDEFFGLIEEGNKLEDSAYELLDRKGCNKIPCKCKCIQEEADKLYDEALQEAYEAQELLREAVARFEKFKAIVKKADMINDKYVECVHERKHCDCK